MKQTKLSEIMGVVFAVTFILTVLVIIYMKFSGNCAIFGSKVESLVGPVICKKPNEEPNEDQNNDESVTKLEDLVEGAPEDVATQDSPLEAMAPGDQVAETNSTESVATAALTPPMNSEPESTDAQAELTSSNISGTTEEIAADIAPGQTSEQVLAPPPPPPPPSYETPALLIADNKLKITSLFAGKVKSLGFKDGEKFSKDDVLVTFDCKETEYDLDIQKEILKDRTESVKNLKKLKELKSTSAYSLFKAESEVAQTQKLIEKLEYELTNCVIKADYAGKVILNSATENQYLQAGQEIMTINNNEKLLVKAYIPVAWLNWLKVGTTFNLCFETDNCQKGVVNRLGAEVDAISQTLDVFGKLTSTDENMIAGLSGQVTFDK